MSYQKSFWKEQLSAANIEQLTVELEETIFSVLAEAGLPVRPGAKNYVEDTYTDRLGCAWCTGNRWR